MLFDITRLRWLITVGLLALCASYVIAGYRAVPFHGDESMLIYMSRDYYRLVQTRDVASQYYRTTPAAESDALDQELRLINGTISKLTIGFAWDMAGYTVADLNQPWYWGMADEYAWNTAHGGLPGDDLLHTARLPSTLFTALSVMIVAGIAGLITRQHTAACIAALIYATTPAVLVNGRRAMMEGSFLCSSALVILCALLLSQATTARRRLLWGMLLGVASGLALASKHTAGLTVVVAFGAVAMGPITKPSPFQRGRVPLPLSLRERGLGGEGQTEIHHIQPTSLISTWSILVLAALIAVIVFLALNPAWWTDPLRAVDFVLDHRRALLDQQVAGAQATGDDHANVGERIATLIRESVGARAQYYEVPYWEDFIGDDIHEYESSGLAGRADSVIWQIILMIALGAGIVTLALRWRDPAYWIGLIWLVGTAAGLFSLIPLDWQRYYMPLYAPVAVTGGIGAARVCAWLFRFFPNQSINSSEHPL